MAEAEGPGEDRQLDWIIGALPTQAPKVSPRHTAPTPRHRNNYASNTSEQQTTSSHG